MIFRNNAQSNITSPPFRAYILHCTIIIFKAFFFSMSAEYVRNYILDLDITAIEFIAWARLIKEDREPGGG